MYRVRNFLGLLNIGFQWQIWLGPLDLILDASASLEICLFLEVNTLQPLTFHPGIWTTWALDVPENNVWCLRSPPHHLAMQCFLRLAPYLTWRAEPGPIYLRPPRPSTWHWWYKTPRQKGFETKPNYVQVGGMPTMVGLASQNGSSLVGDSTVWQLDIDGGEWRQVAWH